MVVIGLIESDIVFRVDLEVTGINIIALQNLLEDLWLVDGPLLHEVNDFVLHSDGMIDIIIELDLDLILQLTSFVHELFLISVLDKVLIILTD